MTMTRRRGAGCAALILTLLVACGAGDKPEKRPSSLSEDKAIDAIEEYHAAWEALDFEKVASLHSDDFEYLFFTPTIEADAFPAILKEVWMTGVVEYEIEEQDFRVLLLPPEHASVTLKFSDRAVYDDGNELETTGGMTYLLQNAGTEWKVRRLHHAGPPPPEFSGE